MESEHQLLSEKSQQKDENVTHSIKIYQKQRYYSDAFMGMRYLTHFSLRRNCTDNILKILTKASGYTLQVLILLESYKSIKVFKSLDVENSRDVTDNGIQYICMFRVRRHKGLKNINHLTLHNFQVKRFEHFQLQYISSRVGCHHQYKSITKGNEKRSTNM